MCINNNIPNSATVILSIFLAGSLWLSACSSNSSSDDNFEDGIRVEIIDFLGEENLNILENDLNMPIHRGDNPPNIEAMYGSSLKGSKSGAGASFLMAPLIMIETVVPDDNRAPDSFWDLYVRTMDQDMNNYTIQFDHRHRESPTGTSIGSFVIGDDDKFTVAGQSVQEREEDRFVRIVYVFSAIVGNDAGLEEAHYSFIMVDNAEFGDLIPNGTGRTFNNPNDISFMADYPEDTKGMKPDSDDAQNAFWKMLMK